MPTFGRTLSSAGPGISPKNNIQNKGAGNSRERDLKTKGMKRINNLYPQIYDMNNLILADQLASRGKSRQPGVLQHNKRKGCNLLLLQLQLINKTYRTGPYDVFTIYEPKERQISRLDYFPHRIMHHAIMNVLEKHLVAMFTADTYSCIKGKGIKAAADAVKIALGDVPATTYCLKFDIRKFYPSIDPVVMKNILIRKFKDQDLLDLLFEIIDSAEGLPIGNYLSQYFANLYLTYFDHWLKEELRVKYYFRYADDIVILAPDKPTLHRLLEQIRAYMTDKLKLVIKDNYQVFPVKDRGIDFVGYKFYHTHTLVRKTIKQNYARELAGKNDPAAIAGYNGWLKHCNSRNLVNKLNHDRL